MDKNIFNELKDFKSFKASYNFTQKEIEETDGKLYCDGVCLTDAENNLVGVSEKWINAGYKIKGSYSKVLSNLFPYEFIFKSEKLSSIESFFQAIKFKDANIQKFIFNYSGTDSNNIQVVSDYNWKESGHIFWQGKEIDRFSDEYTDMIDELYISAVQNPLYRQALKGCDKYILHSIGGESKFETVFTRYEFERQLNVLKDFLRRV